MSEPDIPQDQTLSLESLEQIDQVCLAFEAVWKAGQVPRIEDHLGNVQGLVRSELFRQLLLLEIDYLIRAGQSATVDHYQARFPGEMESINRVFGTLHSRSGEPKPSSRVRYFGDYELLAEVGRGGMGVVHKARQVSLNRIVALKMIRAGHLARDEEVERFRREAEAAANLQHPTIVAIYEVGIHEGQHYFSMEYVEGDSLEDRINQRLPPSHWTAELLKTLAIAIAYAHSRDTLRHWL